ncbi:winged helix DNA-binding domain-containing protein [Wenjunlia tyrosinilytica]|uniref:Winged helix DNA-binding domain-containing protein n=1 Tax=Wenjunlia tyrosinilytica TaxID=1544741 RepID=A0A918DWJ9_9ACTN|nr:winged helix DNA-binding domain-containing protein [Wenjunlia tyrosinilytica]GGO85796.1 hypothetical protein GCM10012280_20410 [Wenjunlia tyrosinilytica]
MIRRIGAEERRARLGVRHRLALSARAATPEEVADAVVALHATDPATVFLAAGARLREPGPGPVERALYEDRTLVRMHGMRHTIFVLPADLAPVVHASTTRAAAVRERSRLVKHLAQWANLDERWLGEVEAGTLAALREHGPATANELAVREPRLRTRMVVFPGTAQEGPQGVSTRILRVLGMDGRIVRGRPRGGWTSGQYEWALAEELPEPSPTAAREDLVRRWLASHGPGTAADLKWWTGWTLTDVRKALSAVGAEEVGLDEGPGYVLPGDTVPTAEPEPWAALLPGLDPTPMSRRHRDWYLPQEHRADLFDRSGNIGPTVWWNGRIVGGWAQRPDGEIVRRLLEDVPREAREAIDAEAARLAGWVGEVRITPRFRTPLERELSA